MFSLESNASGSYRPVHSTDSEEHAVSVFSDMLDQRVGGESVRIVEGGVTRARCTPKTHFMDKGWQARADRALTRI